MSTLIQRIKDYHEQEKPGDGHGNLLTILEMEEVLPGIVAARDSLGEMDLFVDAGSTRSIRKQLFRIDRSLKPSKKPSPIMPKCIFSPSFLHLFVTRNF